MLYGYPAMQVLFFYSILSIDVITSLVSLEHGVYGWEKVTSQRDVSSNGLA
jgi:hypothetical protein